jgi:hypothetical protein
MESLINAISHRFNIREKHINCYKNDLTGNITVEMFLLKNQKVNNSLGLMENEIFENHPTLTSIINYTFIISKENYVQFFNYCYDLD